MGQITLGQITCTELKFVNSTSTDIKSLPVTDVTSIIPVIDKEGKPHLLIEFYDWEFCMDGSLFCDSIEVKNKEENNG